MIPGIDPARLVFPSAIGRIEAARCVRALLLVAGIDGARVELSDMQVRRGTLFNMAGARVTFPEGEVYESCYVALVDPQPDAQWAHPAWWAFIPVNGNGCVVLLATEFPEHALGAVRMLPAPTG